MEARVLAQNERRKLRKKQENGALEDISSSHEDGNIADAATAPNCLKVARTYAQDRDQKSKKESQERNESTADEEEDQYFALVEAVYNNSAASRQTESVSDDNEVQEDSEIQDDPTHPSGQTTLTAEVVDEVKEREKYLRESATLAVSASVVNVQKQRFIIALGVTSIVCAMLTVLGIVLSLTKSTRTEAPTMSPSLSPQTRWDRIASIVLDVETDDVDALLLENDSPQRKALEWLAFDDAFRVSISDEPHLLQRNALAVLYFATNGSDWDDQLQFLSPVHECDWSASITCTTTPNTTSRVVTQILLRENNLRGSLPSQLARLTGLQSLVLDTNQLSGTIPSLPSTLEDIELHDNLLSGPAFGEGLLHLNHQLKTLSLGRNSLTGHLVPTIIGNIRHLQVLNIQLNELSGTIPAELWDLSHLRVVSMDRQVFSGQLPDRIGDWRNLTHFEAHNMNLTGTLPTTIGLLTHLTSFQVAANHLRGTLPTEIGRLTNIVRFSASMNGIGGTVPSEMTQLVNMKDLYIQNTWLEGSLEFMCAAIDDGELGPFRNFRADLEEVECSCCTCCGYRRS